MFLILLDSWVEHIPLVRMVKFKFLAQLPMDHLAHAITSSLILALLLLLLLLLQIYY